MDKYYFYILVGILVVTNIILHRYIEKYPELGYVRTNTMGRLLPRPRDRDNNPKLNKEKLDSNNILESNNIEVQHIKLDEESGNYMWNPYLNFPNGAYVYNSTYPVYLAKDICPEDKPYYSTIDGKCIFVDVEVVKNTPSGSPDKIFNSDLPGYVYTYTPS
jgi:hypothetical protein